MSEEELKKITPEELEEQNRIIDYEIKQMELLKGRIQITVLKLTLVGGALAVIRFALEYGLEWYKFLAGAIK
jgi:hypothetical protein